MNRNFVVILDNAAIHHVDEDTELIEERATASVLFLPPYSPDSNPLEEVFSQIKSIMKKNRDLFEACTFSRPLLLIAFSMVTAEDCKSYIHDSGYAL